MNKAQKTVQLNELEIAMKNSTSLVMIDYTGLNVSMQEDLRNRLREVGATMKVVKNTLFRIAGENTKAPKEALTDTVLEGPSALVYTNGDPIAPLQVLGKFAKEKELTQFKVGIVEGSFQDKLSLVALSKLPSKDVLVGQALGTIAAPLYGFIGILNAPMQKLIYVLDQASKKE